MFRDGLTGSDVDASSVFVDDCDWARPHPFQHDRRSKGRACILALYLNGSSAWTINR